MNNGKMHGNQSRPSSGSVTIISDFWQPFCVGKNNGGHKARLRKTNCLRKTTFARLSRGSETVRAADGADVRDTCASSSLVLLVPKKTQKITEYRDPAPFRAPPIDLLRRSFQVSRSFRCSCVDFATIYNVHYDNRQAGHLLGALHLERCTAAIIFPTTKWRKKITE